MTAGIEVAVSNALSDGYAAAYAYVYYAAVAVGIVGLIACMSLKNYDNLFTDHVSRQIYNKNAEVESIGESTEADRSDVEKVPVKEPTAEEATVSVDQE